MLMCDTCKFKDHGCYDWKMIDLFMDSIDIEILPIGVSLHLECVNRKPNSISENLVNSNRTQAGVFNGEVGNINRFSNSICYNGECSENYKRDYPYGGIK